MSEKPTILIVDDEWAIARAIEIRLRAQGYEVLLAHDGGEGLEAAQQHRPDAIVLDVRMPVMDGMEVLARLATKKETKDIPVVIASASMVDRSRALDMGARFFLEKPYDFQALSCAIEQLVRFPLAAGVVAT